MDAIGSELLAAAIHSTHGGAPRWLESVRVREVFGDVLVWEGDVQVFELADHPTATRAYAWSFEVVGRAARKIVTVLAVPPVDSPASAVRANVEGATTTVPVLAPIG
jgi:hypothetical protein